MQNKLIQTAIFMLISTVFIGCYSNYHQQAKIYEQKKDYASAISAYKNMAEKSGTKGRLIAQSEIGRLYVKLGKYWEAKEILKKAKKGLERSDPRYADVCFNLGYCYYETGDEWFNQAIAEFDEALKIKRDFSKAHFYASVIYYRHKEYERALNHLTSVKDKLETQAQYIAGMCHWRLSEYEKAATMVRNAYESEDDREMRARYQKTLNELMTEWDANRKMAKKIIKVDVKPVFAAIYKRYAENPIGTVVIKNPTEKVLRDVKVILNVPSFMDEPTINPTTIIPPGKEVVVELKAAFNEKMREVQDDIENKPIKLVLEYTTTEGKKIERKQAFLDIYDVNATDWKPNESIAAFIAYDNAAVHTITRYAANADNTLEKAIQIYDTLNEYGIEYALDPEDPYGQELDYVMYPWETLKVKKGDCDDLSVLYAACLQNIGIDAALVLTPSHVFVMFDSGMSASRADRVILDQNLRRIENKTAWIPVEVTMLGKLGKSFFDAWKKGKDEYNPELERVYINKAWQTFKPAWSGPEVELELPDKNAVLKAYYSDIAQAQEYWRGIIDEEISVRLSQLKSQPDNVQILNRLGINYAMNGKFDLAEEQFRKAVLLEPTITRSHSNLANVLLLQGIEQGDADKLNSAEEEYNKALQQSPDSASVRINMAICYFAQQKPDKAQSAINESPDREKLAELARELGIPVPDSPRAGDLKTLIDDQMRKLLRETLGGDDASAGTRATGISEPEDLQWWLSWMK